MDKKYVKIDLKDRRILNELDMDARMPINKLANLVGLSRQVVKYRIERMKKDGIIIDSVAVFDSAVAGYGWYRLVLRLGPMDTPNRKEEIIHFLSNHSNSLWVGIVGGNWDIVVNFIARDNYAFNALLENFLGKYGAFVKAYESLVYVKVRDQKRSHVLENQQSVKGFNHKMKFDPLVILDNLDWKIISVLSKDCSHSNFQIGQICGVSDKTIKSRVKFMEDKKLLLGYRLLIHPSAIGYEPYMVFLGIHNLQADREDSLLKFLSASSGVTYVVKHIGRWRIGLEIEAKNRMEFQDFLVNLREKFGDIINDFEIFPIFRDYKINYFPAGDIKKS